MVALVLLGALVLVACGVGQAQQEASPSDTPLPSPTPYPSTGARCKGTQAYRIVTHYKWKPADYEKAEPGLGFTPLICAGHSHKYSMWREDALLRDELYPVIKDLNLTRIEQSLFAHVNEKNGTVSSYNRSGIAPIMESPGGLDVVYNITLDGDMNATLISCFTAFVPSPDWFTGFRERDMCELNAFTGKFSWAASDDDFGIVPYDAGIDGSERIQYESKPEVPPKLVRVKPEYLSDLGLFNISNMNETLRSEKKKEEEAQNRTAECFPASALVTLWNGAQRRMDQVQLGDVLANAGRRKASPVYMFTHRDHDVYASFVRVHFGVHRTLTASSGHFVYANGALKAMGDVTVGDSLHADNGAVLRVRRVDEVWERGLYNPHTISGELVVNGVRVSAYTRAVKPAAAHSMLAVLRALQRCALSRRWNAAVSTFFEDERVRSRLVRFVDLSRP